MAVNPTISVGFTPRGCAIDPAKPFGNDSFFLMFFMPNWPFGFGHHFIGTDNVLTGQVQEIAEK